MRDKERHSVKIKNLELSVESMSESIGSFYEQARQFMDGQQKVIAELQRDAQAKSEAIFDLQSKVKDLEEQLGITRETFDIFHRAYHGGSSSALSKQEPTEEEHAETDAVIIGAVPVKESEEKTGDWRAEHLAWRCTNCGSRGPTEGKISDWRYEGGTWVHRCGQAQHKAERVLQVETSDTKSDYTRDFYEAINELRWRCTCCGARGPEMQSGMWVWYKETWEHHCNMGHHKAELVRS